MNQRAAKREMDNLMGISEEMDNRFNSKELTPQLRKELFQYIKNLISNVGMVREDKDKTIQLWVSQSYKDYKMAPDIVIYEEKGCVFIHDEILWKTISGLNEVVRGD
ncbi:gp613 [Bacillus phage G]|uniref:Gp613 n=1 Tax=Bacillus phage G TaxID=2884420 RepID=G3MAZ3_9CAUD|nr:gp613 [Bacillus phage G]AEO93858.1 gp613 [Bacillus phage G]